ncbi:MAG: hypothetical protein IJA10_10440 [Lachnospiraceae bacterium]|nr:hypothetical protein [Lachnospiraceae bacterium]
MNLLITNDIDDNVFSTTISVKEMGSSELTNEQEIAICKDFPRKVIFKNLDFTGKFSVVDNAPVLTNGNDDEEVTLTLTNQEISVDENFVATYRTDMKKVADSELGAILNTKELVCQARCLLFTSVVKAELKRILDDIREKATSFTGETEEMI